MRAPVAVQRMPEAPPAYTPSAPPPAYTPSAPPPAYTPSAPTAGTGGQEGEPDLDELARRLMGPLTRLLRAELRMDRERVGRLRDRRS